VLRSFAATGGPPDRDVLDEAARPFGSSQVLAELADGDYLCLDQGGQFTAAYPFSATPTPHTARITGGPTSQGNGLRSTPVGPGLISPPIACDGREVGGFTVVRRYTDGTADLAPGRPSPHR
jgi:hypothetical protein